jgi:uncharacterized repeat protein (TIGR03837 family)
MRWDIFCKVIDNFGDIAICWRLSCQLAQRGVRVRLWVDDPSALGWLAPEGCEGVSVIPWSDPAGVARATAEAAPDVLVEAFGCDPAPELLARFAASGGRAWINLEYLSAEPYVERLHGLPSPVFRGPGEGLTKHFFYPGFTPATGGLLREDDLPARQAAFDRSAWLAARGLPSQGERLVSLFCYEPPALQQLLEQLAAAPTPQRLLVTAGRATAAVRAAWPAQSGERRGALSVTFLPLMSQRDYDELLWACDFNFVRGEDSVIRALWAGRAFAWQIYPQDDDVHHVKLDAFLDMLDAPPSWRCFHQAWNGVGDAAFVWPDANEQDRWATAAQHARARLLAQEDLVTQLLRFG